MNTIKNQAVANSTVYGESKLKGRPRKDYWDIKLVMEYIEKEKFQTLTEYKNWVIEQNFDNIFPVNPNIYYKDYPGVDAFLGNPQGTSKARVRFLLAQPENRAKSLTVRRTNAKTRRAEKAKEIQKTIEANKVKSVTRTKTEPVIGNTYKPDVAQCFKTLLEHNVSFETLYKVNNEMANLTTKEARDITGVLFDFLSKKSKTTV